jgi:hypothetical protein
MRPYLRAANVGWQGLRLEDVKEMNFSDDELEVYRLEPGDIVMSEASGSAGEVGKPALWDGQIPDCCFQNTLIRVRSRGVDPSFLVHLLRYEAIRGAFAEGSRGVGIHHVGAARISSWPIPLPPIAEQRRIVEALEDHLSRLEAAEQLLRNSASRFQLLSRGVSTAAVEGQLTSRSHDPGASSTDFILERKKIWIMSRDADRYREPALPDLTIPPTLPYGWSLWSLEAVTHPVRTVRYGILMPKVEEGEVPYIEVKDLTGNSLAGKDLHKTS